MSGWNWLHAGLEVATYAKAQKAQRDLAEMKSATEIEAARRALIEAMRSFIFDISRDIQLAEEQLETYPQQVYIVSSALDWRLSGSGLSADVFPELQDKEYVFKTQKKITEVVGKSKAGLTEQQIEDSDQAVQYISEMGFLQKAIPAEAARESLAATNEEWQGMSSRKSKQNLHAGLGVAGLMLSACVGLPVLFSGLGSMGSGSFGGVILGLLLMVISGAMPVGSIALLIRSGKFSNPDHAVMKKQRETWTKQLLPAEDRKQAKALFGGSTSEQLQGIYQERMAFLAPLLGDDFQKYLTA